MGEIVANGWSLIDGMCTGVHYFGVPRTLVDLVFPHIIDSTGQAMPFFEFIWLERVIEKLAEREISIDEIEAIVNCPEWQDRSRATGLPVAFGHLTDGRFVIVVYQWIDRITVQPITAYEVPD